MAMGKSAVRKLQNGCGTPLSVSISTGMGSLMQKKRRRCVVGWMPVRLRPRQHPQNKPRKVWKPAPLRRGKENFPPTQPLLPTHRTLPEDAVVEVSCRRLLEISSGRQSGWQRFRRGSTDLQVEELAGLVIGWVISVAGQRQKSRANSVIATRLGWAVSSRRCTLLIPPHQPPLHLHVRGDVGR